LLQKENPAILPIKRLAGELFQTLDKLFEKSPELVKTELFVKKFQGLEVLENL